MKAKILKRIVAVLCAISMSTSVVVTSAGAVDTSDAEAAFSMQYMNFLPKPGEGDFGKFSGEFERNEIKIKDKETNQYKTYIDTLQDKKSYDVKYPSDKNKYIKEKNKSGEQEKIYDSYNVVVDEIEEKKVYTEIIQKVNELKDKVKKRTPDEKAVIDDIKLGIKNNKISKHYDMPYEMRLAKAIYRWVAKEIPYDYDSLAKGIDLKTGKKTSLRKPQDPLYVFDKKIGVCAGKANLLNLMMRLAGIPSVLITSHTHAFNAVYLKDTVNNREGWTLIDATWGAPSSDKSLQVGAEANKDNIQKEKEKINLMIKGTVGMSVNFMRDNFAMDDEYAEEIDDMIYIYIDQRKKMNNAEIDDFNKQLELKLNELNANASGRNGFKLNKIKIFKDKNGEFLVEYETNVKQDEAEDFYEQLQEEIIKDKANDMLKTRENKLVTEGFEELNKDFYEKFNKINKIIKHRYLKHLKQTPKYWEEFKVICDKVLPKYKNELINNINLMRQYNEDRDSVIYKESKEKIKLIVDDMNKTINSEIEILNQKYQYLVTVKNIDISFQPALVDIGDGSISVQASMHFNLPLGDAIKAVKKQSQWSDMKEFFLGFYDKTMTFKYANENIIDWRAHKIEYMVFGNWFDNFEADKREFFDLKINGVKYEMRGVEGNKTCRLTGDIKNPLENVVISPDLVGTGMRFEIGSGIKSLVLKGNESVDLSFSPQLKSIDVTESKKYMVEDGILYKIKEDGSKFGALLVPDGIKFIDLKEEQKRLERERKEKEEQERLERERKEKEEQERLERKKNIESEYKKVLKKFAADNREFRSWRDSLENKGKGVEDLQVRGKRIETIGLYRELDNKFDVKKAEQFIKVAKKAIDMMDKFKKKYEKEKANKNNFAQKIQAIWKGRVLRAKIEADKKAREEKERLEKKYQEVLQQHIDKIKYIDLHFVMNGIKVNWNELVPNKKEIQNIKNKLATSFDINKAEQCIKIYEIGIENMDKFIKEKEEQGRKAREEKERVQKESISIYEEFSKLVIEFRNWRYKNLPNRNEDSTITKRNAALSLYQKVKNNRNNIEELQKFIDLAKESMNEMKQFMREKSANKVVNNVQIERKPVSDKNKERLNAFYNKAREVIGQINENISDFKKWLLIEHSIRLEDEDNLSEDGELISEAKKIVDEAKEAITSAEAEIGESYTDERTAMRVNKSLINKAVGLRNKIQQFEEKNLINK